MPRGLGRELGVEMGRKGESEKKHRLDQFERILQLTVWMGWVISKRVRIK